MNVGRIVASVTIENAVDLGRYWRVTDGVAKRMERPAR